MSASTFADLGIIPSIDPENELAIVVSGQRISGWTACSVTASVEQFPRFFSVSCADPFWNDPGRAMPLTPGAPLQIFIGNDLVLTGFADTYSTVSGPDRHEVVISGRGKGEDLSDCSVDPTVTPALQGATIACTDIVDLAAKLCTPFSISVIGPKDTGVPIPPLTVHLGESPYDVIERVARYVGCLVFEDEKGNLILARVGTDQMASGFTENNVESASNTLSMAA